MEVYIKVRNFGKIEQARINITNFTVFVGNNNSGKTQLMELIYAIIKKLSAITPDMKLPTQNGVDIFNVGTEDILALNNKINKYLDDNIHEIIEQTFNSSIPIDEVRVEFENIDTNYEIYILTDRTIEFLLTQSILETDLLTEMIQNKKQYYGSFIIKSEGGMEKETKVDISHRFSTGIPVEFAKNILMGSVLSDIIGGRAPISENVLFLPASRMGLMQMYKHYFGSESEDKAEMIRNKNQNSKGITKPVLDFLSFLLKYSYTERMAKKNENIIEFISEHLIDGKISEKGEATIYTPKDQEKEIPIFVASSMVNEVVPIVKALTDSDKIDFIFYDEVETSMHPLKQIEMVKLLNRLNNSGTKLIVSTHSDTMAIKINNLLLLSYMEGDFDKVQRLLIDNGISIEKEDLLISKKIHVYQFVNNNQGKSVVKELDFVKTPYIGYDFTLFNDSTMHLFDEAKIVMRIDNENKGTND